MKASTVNMDKTLMEANIDLYQQHQKKGWKAYLEIFIENLDVEKIPHQQQIMIDHCFKDIATNNMDSVSFELIVLQLVVDLNEQMIVWKMIKNLRVNQLFHRGVLHVYLLSLPDVKSCLSEIGKLIGVFLEASYALRTYQIDQNIIVEPQELVHQCLASFLKAETALCITLFILRELAGPKFDYETIFIPNNRDNFDCNIARLLTNANVVFHDGPIMASFSVNKLTIKNSGFDKQYSQDLKAQVNDLLITLEHCLSLTEKVKKFILSVEKPAMLSIEKAANMFSMSPTTFRRKLKDEQQCFKQIQNEVIEVISIKVLSKTSITIDDFAQYIGYSERSSFERFFRSKFGVSPAKYRKNILQNTLKKEVE